MSNSPGQDRFADIRPYQDEEVQPTLQRLLGNQELLQTICSYRYPKLTKLFPGLINRLAYYYLAHQAKKITCVRDFQLMVVSFMEQMIKRTTTRLTWSGLDKLDKQQSYLFLSNHRDIAMDPAFVNWALHNNQMDTVRIAIGSNLLQRPYISDIMRLNKSFIVKRGEKGKAMLNALKQLSEYIHHSITEGHSIWIAQREGRAKDGNDITDPAILKMLHIARRKQDFSGVLANLRIVPVTISYEFDPCDDLKSEELATRAREGHYQKAEFEDISSIIKGILGEKGAVHIAFGEPISGEFESPEQLAKEVDKQIHLNYRLHSSNLIAAGVNEGVNSQQVDSFNQRITAVSSDAQGYLKAMYAYPYQNQQAAKQS